jgi:hypothetical protein
MKNLLKYSILTLVALVVIALNACEEERWGNIPNLDNNIGAVTLVNVNPDKTFYNALNDLATEEVEFQLDVDGFEITEINSIDVELIFTENDATLDAEGNPADVTYDPVLVSNVDASTLPATITFSATEALTAIQTFKPGFTIDSLEVGDGFNLIFPINTADGRRLTTALSSELCNEPVQPSFGGCNVAWFISCPSDIPTGTYNTTVTTAQSTDGCCTAPITDFKSTVAITSPSTGVYSVDDIFAGLYIEWYDVYGLTFKVPQNFSDVCNNLTTSFIDPFGGAVIMTGTYDPATGAINFDGSNEFGDTWKMVWTPQ